MTTSKDVSEMAGAETIFVQAGESVHKVVVLGSSFAGVGDSLPNEIRLGRDARADLVLVVLPGVDCDEKLDVILEGEGAEAAVSGVYLCGNEEKVNISVDVHHNVPHCMSRQIFKGLAGGKSRVDFYGKIIVAPDAQVTEAYQENHNLLLSDDAKVNTKPQLEIYADDVKCSHGATVGRLNEEEQFYMRSRGITLEQAKVLQMISFVYPVLEHIGDVSLRSEVSEAVEAALKKMV